MSFWKQNHLAKHRHFLLSYQIQVLWREWIHRPSWAALSEEGIGFVWLVPRGMGGQCSTSFWITCKLCSLHWSCRASWENHGSSSTRRGPSQSWVHDPHKENLSYICLLRVLPVPSVTQNGIDWLWPAPWKCQALPT